VPQYLVSNFHGPWLVDVVAAIVSMTSLALFLRVWQPAEPMTEMPGAHAGDNHAHAATAPAAEGGSMLRVWAPWLILSVFVFAWGVPEVKKSLDSVYVQVIPVDGLHKMVQKVPPVVAPADAATDKAVEKAEFKFNILSATGTGIFLAAIVSAFILGYGPLGILQMYAKTFWMVRYSLLTIAAMLALGYVTKYSGTDATMGLLLANTGFFYPFFGTMIGWLGVALTGSDTASNVLFGGLQKVSAQQLGLDPVLMASANSSGGVMGKMIDAQSIVVASTATKWYGNEGAILRFVFFHSVVLASLVGLLVMAQAYVWPFTELLPDGAVGVLSARGH
jgi:lactate permease